VLDSLIDGKDDEHQNDERLIAQLKQRISKIAE